MRLDDAANLAHWHYLERRAANAPHGQKRKREAEKRDFAHRMLRQDVRMAGKRRRG